MTERAWRVTRVWRNVEARTAADALEVNWSQRRAPDDTHVHRDTDDIENRRRDFMADEPELYAYIEARVAARELKRAGGDASGATDNYGAANRVWALGGQWEQKWRAMRTGLLSQPAGVERFAVCPHCGAEYPDFHSPVGSLGTLCDNCGWSSDEEAGR